MKIHPTLLLLLSLAACSDWNDSGTETVPYGSRQQGAAISFAGSVAASETAGTRADGSLVNRLETSLFETKDRTYWGFDGQNRLVEKTEKYMVGVFGAYTGNQTYHEATQGNTATANFMYNQPLTIGPAGNNGVNPLDYYSFKTIKDSEGTAYTPTDSLIRFWPNTQDGSGHYEKVSFWAYYPYNPTVTSGGPGEFGIHINTGATGVGKGAGMGKVLFTMNPDASEQSDFMISELVADCSKDTYPLVSDNEGGYAPRPVQFKFHHMLAQVRIYGYVRGKDRMSYYGYADGDNTFAWRVKSIDTGAGTVTLRNRAGTVDNVVSSIPASYLKDGNYWYVDAYGMTRALAVGDSIPDDTPWLGSLVSEIKTERWERGTTLDVTNTRYRSTATYSLAFNNTYTSCTFTPEIIYNETTHTYTTRATYSDQGALGSATVNHYIMNPYWFRFLNGEREMVNETYMYNYFEGTPAAKGQKNTLNPDGTTNNDLKGYDGWDWSNYSGSTNILNYTLDEENEDFDYAAMSEEEIQRFQRYDGYSKSVNTKLHYNYPTGNIILAVPQVLDDDNVPNITVDATGKKVKYVWEDGAYVQAEPAEATARLTINLLQMNIKWESGFIYCYAFTENDLQPGDDKVRGPETVTVVFDPQRHTDQW